MSLLTPPQSPIMTSTAPIPIPAPRTATPISTILRTSPPSGKSLDDYFVSFEGLMPPTPPSPPSLSPPASETTSPTLSGPHTPLTPLTPLSDRNINTQFRPSNELLKPFDAGLLSDSDISSLDLGPAYIRSQTPSPSPSLIASLSPQPKLTLDEILRDCRPVSSEEDRIIWNSLQRRDTAEQTWHARGQNKRRAVPRTDSSMSFDSVFSDSEGRSNIEDTNLERTVRNSETRSRIRKPVVAFAYAGSRKPPRGAWHH